jgi:glycosyltransferase involved in cell wall biosynthesis
VRLAYLYSRYPLLTQTFCDTEMLELERRGRSLLIASIEPPLTTVRHAQALRLRAPIHFAPPDAIVGHWEDEARTDGRWPAALVEEHERKYGDDFKPAVRARNGYYFAELFRREGIQHFHVNVADHAAHTALFIKQITGVRFSVTVNGRELLSDARSAELLREICAAAEFVAVETEFSRELLASRYPAAAAKFVRAYNGMDLEALPPVAFPLYSQGAVRLLSAGPLVEFSGFTHLIAACAELRGRGLSFTCEIIGDGPLREALQAQITEENLDEIVTVSASLPQESLREKLRSCDIFALASVVDSAGASDALPPVILEAMASSRVVVATDVAGIPEAVVHCGTGLLAPPGDSVGFANLLDRLIRDQWYRTELGNAGRARVEQNFQVEMTIEPLVAQFDRIGADFFSAERSLPPSSGDRQIGYLIDRWPDADLPLLETELLEMEKLGVPVVAFVCDFAPAEPLNPAREQLATRLTFLPDPMVIEAEWQQNRSLAHELESDRASETHRAPSALFLQQARYAIALRSRLAQHKIAHLHATSSRALICGVMLKKLTGLTLSATIETNPQLQVRTLRSALARCDGGRVSDPKLSAHLSSSFLLEPGGGATLLPKFGVGSKRHNGIWQKWSELLESWRSHQT